MGSDRVIGMLIRAAMDTAMRHLPRWLARRQGGAGGAPVATREREIARKLRMTRRLMRWFR